MAPTPISGPEPVRPGFGGAEPDEEEPIGRYLREQARLQTPVARFSDAFDRQEPRAAGREAEAPALRGAAPASDGSGPASRYRDLIPLTAPAAGEQYAFEVDLDACTGCKSCVAACHSLNGLDEGEAWRVVEGVCGRGEGGAFQQFVTAACHHCADPGCLNGCPVLAYEKDPATGIVRHLDDQCIGCQYCVWKCPYEAPKYNARLGIVRKCDLCRQRLAHGEAPACAQACPTRAIRIVTAPARPDTARFFPTEPDPDITLAPTRYLTRRALPADLRALNGAGPQPQAAHWPLAAMLVLMQGSAGILAGSRALAAGRPEAARLPGLDGNAVRRGADAALGAAALALAVGVAHLGQPRRAWRILLNLRKSWFSREALAFGAYLPALALAAVAPAAWRAAAAAAALGVGLAGTFCSAMLYADTARPYWTLPRTAGRFLGTSLVIGLAWAWASRPAAFASAGSGPVLALIAATVAKLLFESETFRFALPPSSERSLAQSARLLCGPLRTVCFGRLALGLLGGVLVPALGPADFHAETALLALGLLFAGELAERHLFFRAVARPDARPRPEPHD